MQSLGGLVRAIAMGSRVRSAGWSTRLPSAFVVLAGVALLGASVDASPHGDLRLTVTPIQTKARAEAKLTDAELAKLQTDVAANPKKRRPRFALVQALRRAGQVQRALEEAKKWRRHDAYNLLAVRMIGDLHAQLGDRAAALRTWSAVVELLPEDASAHRALASALKQAGEIAAACARLRRAVALHHYDHRLQFEMADCEQRTGDLQSAASRFGRIAGDSEAPSLVRGPARQRLAQTWGDLRRTSLQQGDTVAAQKWQRKRGALRLPGGLNADLKVFLSWDTDRSDIDLWVTNPKGERVWYRNKQSKHGGALFGDVTTGYGPEMYSTKRVIPGVYKVQVQYFGTPRRGLREARGEVVIVTGEGRADERRIALPYELDQPGSVVTVAQIRAQ